jgi:hypothetical protein
MFQTTLQIVILQYNTMNIAGLFYGKFKELFMPVLYFLFM